MQLAVQTGNTKGSSGICFSREDKAVTGLGPAAYWRYVRSPRRGTNAVFPPENKFRNGYWADVVSTNDYYPFGMGMVERGDDGSYRYGFQGQVRDDELKGAGNSLNFKYRMHDARLGRFFAVDPLSKKYPWNSPHAFSENRVVDGVELEGAERLSVHTPGWKYRSKTVLRNETATSAQKKAATLGATLWNWQAALAVGDVQFGGINISSVAGRVARHVANASNMTTGIGTERNAFRHALWSAKMTADFGEFTASIFGNAHEGIPVGARGNAYVDFNQPAPDNLDAADDIVDFLNNEIGREIGSKFGANTSQIEIAKEVLRVQKEVGLWTAKETDKGIEISRTKITEDQYNAALQKLSTLDKKDGMDDEDRLEIEKAE